VGFLIAIAAVIVGVLVVAFLMDRQDKRRGRKARVRMPGWLQREGQIRASKAAQSYLMDSKGVGSTYSGDALRGMKDDDHSAD
jgi:hypothetical protein